MDAGAWLADLLGGYDLARCMASLETKHKMCGKNEQGPSLSLLDLGCASGSLGYFRSRIGSLRQGVGFQSFATLHNLDGFGQFGVIDWYVPHLDRKYVSLVVRKRGKCFFLDQAARRYRHLQMGPKSNVVGSLSEFYRDWPAGRLDIYDVRRTTCRDTHSSFLSEVFRGV